MSDFQNEMNRTVQSFVAQITELARRAAIDTLESAFGGRAARGPVAATATVAATTSVAARAGRPRARGAKRSPEDLEALSDQLGSFVKANPGLRIEQINKQLGTTTKDLALPIRKLIASGVISSKGQKRSTTYFPGKKAKN
jgi:predicted HTH transcriptional regulator